MSIDQKEFERLKEENRIFNKQVPELYQTIAGLKLKIKEEQEMVDSYMESTENLLKEKVELQKEVFSWIKLEKIATPDKWLKMYADYQELLLKEDVGEFWADQFRIVDNERQILKVVEVPAYKTLLFEIEKYLNGDKKAHSAKSLLEMIDILKKM